MDRLGVQRNGDEEGLGWGSLLRGDQALRQLVGIAREGDWPRPRPFAALYNRNTWIIGRVNV
jgi:hypothetical protein